MPLLRLVLRSAALTVLLLAGGCTPSDPRLRLQEALATLESTDASPSSKAEACTEIRLLLAQHPIDAADRTLYLDRAARLLVAALRDRESRLEAQAAIAQVGVAAFEPLFATVVEADPATQEAAITCLIRMSNTAVPVLLPALTGDDPGARDRAERVLIRLGTPVTAILRTHHAALLEPFTGLPASAGSAGHTELSVGGTVRLTALARVFAGIGDRASVLALLEGCERLHHRHPDVAREYLRLLDGLGRDALAVLNAGEELDHARLRAALEP